MNIEEPTIEDLAAEVKAIRDTLQTLIVWLVLELGEPAVDKLLAKLEIKPTNNQTNQ
jgi:hypothetical protein